LSSVVDPQRPILITGSTGQVGGELVRMLAPLGPIHAPTRAELDLSDPASIRTIVHELKPRWIVNPAAYTAVDRAEAEPDLAFAINATAPGILGEEAAKIGAAVLHFSTDYIFAGTGAEPYAEDAPAGSLGVYGASKLAGEQALAASGAAHLIVRTSWVYGATGKNFLLTVLRVAREREQMSIVDDQHGAPTWSRELARLAVAILTKAPDAVSARAFAGIYHAAAQGETTWFGFAQEALRLRRVAEPTTNFAELIPIPTYAYPTPAKRPANSRLDTRKLQTTFGFEFLPWPQALAEVLAGIPLPDAAPAS
jgi:dTDP-4-dehydrorhamnose reductase